MYQKLGDDWQGKWQILIVRKDNHNSATLIKEITWMGYRKLYKNIYLFPNNGREYMEKLAVSNNLKDDVIFLEGDMLDLNGGKAIGQLIEETWDIGSLVKVFKNFLDSISGINKSVLNEIRKSPELSMYVRLKLIHEYRRMIIKYNKIPQRLHRQDGVLSDIYSKLGNIYHQLADSSVEYVTERMQSPLGKLPKPEKRFYQRFSISPSQVLKDTSNKIVRLSQRDMATFLK